MQIVAYNPMRSVGEDEGEELSSVQPVLLAALDQSGHIVVMASDFHGILNFKSI